MHCANHPDIAGIGVCVSCRKVICASCTTRLQGRNFCVECIEAKAVDRDTDIGRSSAVEGVGMLLAAGLSATLLVGSLMGFGFLLYLAG